MSTKSSPPSTLRPETGGRFSLTLVDQDESEARFDVELVTATGLWRTRAQVSSSEGGVSWNESELLGSPDWLRRYAHAALRSAWRQRGEAGWPRRLTRWRDEPVRSGDASDEGS